MAAKSTANLLMDQVDITFDGNPIGYSQGDVELSVTVESEPILVNDFGDTPVERVVTAREATVKVPITQNQADLLDIAFPGNTLTGTTKLEIDSEVGTKLGSSAAQLVLHPTNNSAGDREQDVVFFKAVVRSAEAVQYGPKTQWIIMVEFQALVDTDNSNRLLLLGDSAAS